MQPLGRQPLFPAFAAVTLCVYAAYFVPYIHVAGADAVYMDSLQLILLYDEVKRGLPFADTWGRLGSVHRGLLAQGYGYLNAEWFGYRAMGANFASGLVLAATAATLGAVAPLRRGEVFDTQRAGLAAMVALASVILISMFSLASFELFTLDYGLVLFTKNFVLIAYWLWLARVFRPASASVAAVFLVCVSGCAIVLLVAMGWSYAFVVACAVLALDPWWIGARTRATALRGAIVVVALSASLALYVVAGNGINAVIDGVGGMSEVLSRFGGVASAVLLAFSSVFIGNETADFLRIPRVVQGAMGGLLLSTTLLVFVCRLRRLGPPSGIPYALMAYAAASIMAVAIARGSVDPGLARASRYFMDFSLLMIGVCWAAWSGPRAVPAGLRRWQMCTAVLAALCCGVFLIGQALTQGAEWWKASNRADVFATMRSATACGIDDDAEASLLQATSRAVAERAVAVQSARSLGVFRNREALPACFPSQGSPESTPP